ncbi:MAG: membrane-bound lytic murein transglycosylase MltF [Alkalispirochaetaceae bacterium]
MPLPLPYMLLLKVEGEFYYYWTTVFPSDRTKRRSVILLASALLFLLAAVIYLLTRPEDRSLQRILEAGTLTFITQNSAHTYWIYRDEPVGFEYDLAAAFAEYLGVEIEVITPPWSEMFDALEEGRGALVGASVTATRERRQGFDFSEGYMVVRQELLVHASNREVRQLGDLAGLRVHLRSGTSYEQRLRELQAGGLDVEIVVHDNLPTEELIRRVSDMEIEATVADTNIAMLNRRYYPDVRFAFSISSPQLIAWAVRRGERALLEEINRFFTMMEETGGYQRIYERHYANVEVFDYFDIRVFHQRISTRLPRYLEAIRRESERFGFDWRLIAALAYQESHYHPFARSHTGVEGFMQVTMTTAREMGIEDRLDPEQSIYAGVKYLSILRERFVEIPDPEDRLLCSMAAYNVGYGHIRDAQIIAVSLGLDEKSWASMEQTLPLLSNPEYYRDTVHGYARGTEPVLYVNRILTYYDILRRMGDSLEDG